MTNNQGYSKPGDGAADWDTDTNANWELADKGILLKATAGETIGSGHAVMVNSDGQAYLHDPASLDLVAPHGISVDVSSSGDEAFYVSYGVIRSMDIWSGNITPGQPVFSALSSPGFLVGSYPGANFPAGVALGDDAILVAPGMHSVTPRKVTNADSTAILQVGTFFDFDVELGHRGLVTNLEIITSSCDAYKVRFWSGSARVSSELLYETLTTSVDGGASDFDVSSLTFEDAALFQFENTDTTSPFLIFGRIDCQSASAVGSSDFGITVIGELMR